ncbi:MAG: EF-Tu/IF-2/RF-3 family GTPase [Methanomassiliicoccales archaeon]|nr:EF-Tu/IF-2/RF-3 family GTPase [Methanomassiliicoccales archaeon]
MSNLTVAVIAPPDYAKDLGKKGTASDITLYDVKRGEDTVSFIEPTKYPDRLAPLFYACSIADSALVVVDEVSSQFGECALMLDAIGLRHGQIILRNFISRDKVAPLIKGTVLESYSFLDEDFVAIREAYLDLAGSLDREEKAGRGAVPIDHFFNVKGVGTVVLGHVTYGTIRRHGGLMVLPGKGSAQVRSIQKHDDDFDTAVKGDRVGLALKGIDAEDLDRGYVLTDDDSMKQDSRIMATATLVKYWPSPLKEGMVVHLGHWMQFLPARVASVEDGPDWRRPRVELVLEKEIVHPPGSRGILCYLDGGKLRVMGHIDLP